MKTHKRHCPRRILRIRHADGREFEVQCLEETLSNFYGILLAGYRSNKVTRFPKQDWEVMDEKFK